MLHSHPGASVIEVIQEYARRGPREVHHTGAPLIRKNASPGFLAMSINDLDETHFKAELHRYLTSGSRRRVTGYRFVSDYNRLMLFAVEEGYRTSAFTPVALPPSVGEAPAPLTAGQVSRFLEALDAEYPEDIPLRVVLRALLFLSLNLGEATRFDAAKIQVVRGFYVVGDGRGRLRHIPIPKEMQVLLARAQHLGVLWDGRSKRWVSLPRLRAALERLGALIGIPGLTSNHLQRTAIHGWEPIRGEAT